MVPSSAGAIVLVPFPFSDLSATRLRPAVVLADADRGDWILCQVTSNSYADPLAVEIVSADFSTGSLHRTSYVRPGKLFTANEGLFTAEVAVLNPDALSQILDAVQNLLDGSRPSTV